MDIAILGSGLMGGTLGRLWAASGHAVTFAYARDPAKLDRLADEAGGRAASVAEAVAGADAILLAVPWSRIPDVLDQAGAMAGRVVLDCSVPLNDANDTLVIGPETSGIEDLARRRPEARWVAAFNTSPSEVLEPVFARKGQDPRPHLLVYGDDDGAKDIACGLVRDIGFEPLEAGGSATGRYVEPFAMVTAVLAYGQPGGPALTYRFQKLQAPQDRRRT